ncbi:MAG: hypothetical protein KC621_33300 [Myxococcales bacterium]|nr:hypothetical protein [Myxococcales bacterium]
MLLMLSAAWAASDDPGPHAVATRSFDVVTPTRGRLLGVLTAPSSGGGYPLVALLHGWTGDPSGHEELAEHIASWGYAVMLPGTNTGLLPDVDDYAGDTAAMMVGVADLSDTPGSAIEGLVDTAAPWSAVGHSMGGGTLGPLTDLEPRIRVIVGMEAAASTPQHEAMFRAYDGASLMIAGSDDVVVPARVVHDWFEIGDATRRNLYVEIAGSGHLAPNDLDIPDLPTPLPRTEQLRLHERLVVAFLQAEVRGEEDRYAELLDPTEPLTVEADCAEPVLVGGAGGVAVLGRAGDTARVGLSAAPGAVPTPWGVVALDPAGASVTPLPLGPDGVGVGPMGAGFAQALAGGALTRSIEIP